ncbi:DUF6461 domain-containing protein [Sphaerisporangium rhizosphaerae]|uniref:DUF6461 domain-containing protein n=1 Tax=Sphaerisporangium rhizosphaerae TaxID=2269375 RepID=A0ABW2NW59_9ACTN
MSMQSRTHLYDLLESTLFTEGLDDHNDLWSLGFCAVWVQGVDIATIASHFSLDPGTRTPCYLSEILDDAIDDGSLWVAEVGDWTCVLPARTDAAFVRSLAAGGGQALSLDMDINNNALFQYARDGRMVVAFEPRCPGDRLGDDPHALDHLMEGLRFQISGDEPTDDRVDSDESLASALELIGRVTRTDIAADWFEAQHSRMRSMSP